MTSHLRPVIKEMACPICWKNGKLVKFKGSNFKEVKRRMDEHTDVAHTDQEDRELYEDWFLKEEQK
jgi:hypothetical protein